MESIQSVMVHLYPECEGDVIVDKISGDTLCNGCGMIYHEHIIDTSCKNHHAFNVNEWKKTTHVGPPIDYKNKIAHTNTLRKKDIKKYNLKRAHKIHSRLTYDKKSLFNVKIEIDRMCGLLNITDPFITDAFTLFKEARNLKMLRGNSLNAWITACLFYICRENGLPQTLKHITSESSVSKKSPNKIYKLYKKLIDYFPLKLRPLNPHDLVPKFTSELNLLWIEPFVRKAISKFPLIIGRDPKGITAGVIYVIGKLLKLPITYKILKKIAGVNEMTIRNRVKEIKSTIDLAQILPITRIPFIRIFTLFNKLFEKLNFKEEVKPIKVIVFNYSYCYSFFLLLSLFLLKIWHDLNFYSRSTHFL